MIQLTAHTTQAFTYFRHRVAAAQYPKKHRNKMRHATEGLVIMVTLLLADDAFDIDSGDYFHKLFQNRLSDKIYFPIFTYVVVFSQNKLTTSGGGPYKAYPLFYFIRSVVVFYYFFGIHKNAFSNYSEDLQHFILNSIGHQIAIILLIIGFVFFLYGVVGYFKT